MKRAVVIGANGMLGYGVSEYFKEHNYDVIEITRKEFDIAKDHIEKLDATIKECDFIVNCAGVIKPRIARTPVEDVLKVNAIFPRNLAKLSNKYDKQCFHITTDCVFSGKKGNYDENDYYDAENLYGLSKNAGDIAECMVIRTSIIGEEKNNNRSLLSWVKSQKGKTVNGYTNHFWNGVTTIYLGRVIERILENNLYENGIFHVFSREIVSKYKLLKLINQTYDLDITVNKYSTPVPCDRSLSTKKDLCEKVVQESLPSQIAEMKAFFAGKKK
ncbi:MAG: SDR family oxidoreductase [Thermoplasmata archaeon]|nr:SDR family oxidoreductase [Thermoplasmata archaeon]